MKEQRSQVCDQSYENADLTILSKMQARAYHIVESHFTDLSQVKDPPALIINGGAGTGKSYLINAIRTLTRDKCAITATTGKTAFNINGISIHSLLKLRVGTKVSKDLTGQSLIRLQEMLSGIDYIIIDEYSMLGQMNFGWIDKRCKQAPGFIDKLLGNKSINFCGDLGQLHPVGDKPLYHAIPTNSIGEESHFAYQMFNRVVKLSTKEYRDMTLCKLVLESCSYSLGKVNSTTSTLRTCKNIKMRLGYSLVMKKLAIITMNNFE